MVRVFPARAVAVALSVVAGCLGVGGVSFGQTGQVRISQVFAGGGGGVTTPRADYVELFNAGDTAVDVTGWSVQAAAATGLSWSGVALGGVIGPRQYYLVQMGANAASGAAIVPDAGPGNANLAGGGGKVALLSETGLLNGRPNCPFPATMVDFVGWGTANQTYPCNGTSNAPSFSDTQALVRRCAGKSDVGLLSTVFQVTTPIPRNLASGQNLTEDVSITQPAPALAYAGGNIVVSVTAIATACGGQVAGVTADLSDIGGPEAAALARVGSTNVWQLAVNLAPLNLAPGHYGIPVQARATLVMDRTVKTMALTVRPANDECAGATVYDATSGPSVFESTNLGAQDDGDPGACTASLTGDRGVWFRFTVPAGAPNGGTLRVTEESAQNVALAVYSGACSSLLPITCTADEEVAVPVGEGMSYAVLVVRDPAAQAAEEPLSVRFAFEPAVEPPGNDVCANALEFDPLLGSVLFEMDNTGATPDIDVGGCTPSTQGDRGVWFTFRAPNTPAPIPGTLSVMEESAQNVAIGLFAAPNGNCTNLVNIGCSNTEELNVEVVSATRYYVLVVRDPAVQPGAQPNLRVRMTFAVTPTLPDPPANDTVCAAVPLTLNVSTGGTTQDATTTGDGPTVTCFGTPVGGGRAVWYSFTPAASAPYRFTTCGSATDTEIALFTVSGCPGGTQTFTIVSNGCDANSCGAGAPGSAAEIVSVQLSAGVTYHLRVGNPPGAPVSGGHVVRVEQQIVSGACCTPTTGACAMTSVGAGGCPGGTLYQGQGTVCSPNPCPVGTDNDECSGAIVLGLGQTIVGSTINATTTASLSSGQCGTAAVDGRDVFFKFTPSQTFFYDLSLCGSSFDTTLGIHTACPPTLGNRLICSDDAEALCAGAGGSPLASRIPFIQLLAGQTYWVRVAGINGDSGTYRLRVLSKGVCCRGTTCSAALTTADACLGSSSPGVGVSFATSGNGSCNTSATATTPCCHADFNKVNGVEIGDIFAYLNAWFTGSPFADISGNGAGAPDINDVFTFLNVWFGGC